MVSACHAPDARPDGSPGSPWEESEETSVIPKCDHQAMTRARTPKTAGRRQLERAGARVDSYSFLGFVNATANPVRISTISPLSIPANGATGMNATKAAFSS
jgi:hypothetical protein